jgi:hypothetical protein
VSDPLDINEPDLRASLLRLDADLRERRHDRRDCILDAYDLIAKKLEQKGIRLTDQERRQTIPAKVLEAALKYNWTSPSPEYRRQRYTRGYFAGVEPKGTAATSSPYVRIPDAQLTERLGAFKMTPDYLKWWLGLLGGRIRSWEAKALDLASHMDPSSAEAGSRQDREGYETQQGAAEPLDTGSPAVENAPPARNKRPPVPNKALRKVRQTILKRYKEKKGLSTMDDLARHLGVGRAALYGMTAGETRRYSDAKLDSVLKQIGCPRAEWDSQP